MASAFTRRLEELARICDTMAAIRVLSNAVVVLLVGSADLRLGTPRNSPTPLSATMNDMFQSSQYIFFYVVRRPSATPPMRCR